MRLVLVFVLSTTLCNALYPACPAGLQCIDITPPSEPSLTFSCATIAGASPQIGNVYHMHGNTGKNSKAIFAQVMLQLAPLGYTSLACDQRGYSIGANPNSLADYNYDELAGDIYAIVDAFGYGSQYGGKFHVVSHDQGARIAWHSIAKFYGRQRYLSFSSLSIPHADVFSNALYGPSPILPQQTASQYVRALTIPDSVSMDNYAMASKLCKNEGWTNFTQCQHTLWWYNGAIDSGAMALAPWYTEIKGGEEGGIIPYLGLSASSVAELSYYPLEGIPQTVKVGDVSEFPVVYACGLDDPSDLCLQIFAEQSGQMITNYTYLAMPHCSHNVLECSNTTVVKYLIKTIILNIQSVDLPGNGSSSTFVVGLNASSSTAAGRRLQLSEPTFEDEHLLMLQLAIGFAMESARSTTGLGVRGASCAADLVNGTRLVPSSSAITIERVDDSSVRVVVVASSTACNEAVKYVVNHASGAFETNLQQRYQQFGSPQSHHLYLGSAAVNGGPRSSYIEFSCTAETDVGAWKAVAITSCVFLCILTAWACCTRSLVNGRRAKPTLASKQMEVVR